MSNTRKITSVLIANRGEIAVRVIRACKDSGLASVAIYAEPDKDALHVRMADQAIALGGTMAAESYLDIKKVIAAAKKSGANAVHPGYGFLSENAEFAQAVVDAGLIWIGPPPQAIRDLGDKVSARHIAARAGAPQVQGTKDPVKDSDEVVAFAAKFGLPIAIKAAFGGGGRGLKVARTLEEIPELYDSAVREAIAAFGRGECFVEQYLDNPRHVETQCLADEHGNVVIVSTRDCSLQRRHQKLVEEAPAPFLTQKQIDELYSSSKAILKEAQYIGAGTCEFLIGLDGTISFLEVNTRLQVEHPVSEEVTGIDLVREQFRLAEGGVLTYSDPEIRGHSIEFRINGEDPGRGFLPAPGKLSTWELPAGPGVRVDTGFVEGDVIGGNFDSLLAKLIVTGPDRITAIERARRALEEFHVDGIATALTFHSAVVSDPAFAPANAETPFSVHTRWIETEFNNTIEAYSGSAELPASTPEPKPITVEVNGKRIEVILPSDLTITKAKAAKKPARAKRRGGSMAEGDSVVAPMQGTIVKVAVEVGQTVDVGDLVIVLEAMKMEQPLTAHKAGTISSITAEIGTTVSSGTELISIAD